MITRAELAANAALKRDRAFGCLIGLAIGDSFGDQARSPENHILYGISRDLYATVSWSTDDTEFALLTAQTLIGCRGELTTEAVVEAWRTHILGQGDLGPKGGESEINAARNLQRGILPPYSGMDNSYNESDGAAMRIAPIGIVCAGDPDRAARLAAVDAQISHDRNGIWGAQAIAASVAVAMVGATVDEVVTTGRRYIPDDSWLGRSFDRAMAIVDKARDVWEAWDPLHQQLWTGYRANNAEAISEVYALYRLTRGDFVDGIIYGGNFGRDADTIAALLGALARQRRSVVGISMGPAGTPLRVMAGLFGSVRQHRRSRYPARLDKEDASACRALPGLYRRSGHRGRREPVSRAYCLKGDTSNDLR